MGYNYALKEKSEGELAKAVGISLPISFKQSIEICDFIRGKPLRKAKEELKEVIEGKTAVPFKRFNSDVGHKKGTGSGRYPKKACSNILNVIENAEANAQFKGLNTANLFVTHILAQKASTPLHYGRKRRRKMKRTHIEVALEEKAKK